MHQTSLSSIPLIRSAQNYKKTLKGGSSELLGGYAYDSFDLHANKDITDDMLISRLAAVAHEMGGTDTMLRTVEADKEITLPEKEKWAEIKERLHHHYPEIASALNSEKTKVR